MKTLGILLVIVIVACVVLATVTSNEVPQALFLGWFSYLQSVLPQVSIDSPTAMVSSAAFILFLIGVHWLGSSFFSRSRPESNATAKKWRIRWTLTVGILLVVSFSAGLSLIGITHHALWLRNSKEPLLGVAVGSPYSDKTNLREIGLAMHNYAGSYGFYANGSKSSQNGAMLHSWETQILPFLSVSTNDINFEKPWNDPVNARYFKCVLPWFINSGFRSTFLDSEGYGLSHYAANIHVIGPNKRMRPEDITDGLANTVLVGEVNENFKPWGDPFNWRDPAKGINQSPNGFGGPWSSGWALFLMADGSVRFFSEKTSPEVLRALSTPAGGESVDVEAHSQVLFKEKDKK